jgi:single-strand DNA-binding protein
LLNKVILIGNLGRDPELRYTTSGKAVCQFSIAVDGGGKNKVEWVNIQTWEKTAENCANYLAKGSMVAVEGRLHIESWEREGQKFYKTVVVAHTVKFLRKNEGANNQASTQNSSFDSNEIDFGEDDIPF